MREDGRDRALVPGTRIEVQIRMGCGPEFERQDDWLCDFLVHDPAWTVDGDTLTLTNGRTTLVLLDRRLAETDLPLDGTTWTVVSVLGEGGRVEHNRLKLRGPTGNTGLNLSAVRPEGGPYPSF
ncbi:MAG TPA: hypothetical protein VGL05_11225 [Kribbella sp.]